MLSALLCHEKYSGNLTLNDEQDKVLELPLLISCTVVYFCPCLFPIHLLDGTI